MSLEHERVSNVSEIKAAAFSTNWGLFLNLWEIPGSRALYLYTFKVAKARINFVCITF